MINSDDWYELDTVEIMANAYKENPTKSIFHADRYDIAEDGSRTVRKFHPSAFKFKYYGMTYNHPSMFITKEEYGKHLYNIELRSLSDNLFVLEAFLRDANTLHYVNKSIVNYRLDGISAKLPLQEKLKEGYIIRKKAGLNNVENIFSLVLRLVVFSIYKIRRIIN